MRESNISNPLQNRACASISAVVYDRRATLPLVNSLNHFAYLASTSPRIREMVTVDGGLERLVQILRAPPRRGPKYMRDAHTYNDLQDNWKWSLAFQCVVNIGVRGSETIRTRVVEAGIAPIIVHVLESFLVAADVQKEEMTQRMHAGSQEPRRSLYPSTSQEAATSRAATPETTSTMQVPVRPETPMETDPTASSQAPEAEMHTHATEGSNASCGTGAGGSGSTSECAEDTEMCTEEGEEAELDKRDAVQATPRAGPGAGEVQGEQPGSPLRAEMLDAVRTPRARPPAVNEREPRDESQHATPSHVYREEEVLMSLQLLAYLSKYPHVRLFFHNADVREEMLFCPAWAEETMPNRSWEPTDPVKRNVFSVAERFTLRSSRSSGSTGALNAFFPRLGHEIQYWAGVVMRNACRKDESRGGIRQCANMLCGKWESYPREFAKCRRCRKAKYCSKQCQSKGWQMGHRFWCSARDDADSRYWKKDASSRTSSRTENVRETETPDRQPEPPQQPTQPAPAPVQQLQHYMRPLGARSLPSTLARSDSMHMPQMRGVSAASVETADPDTSESATAPPSDTPSPALAPRTGGPFAGHALPPPIIAGSLDVSENDPTTTTLREHEVQDVQEHGVLEMIASSWPTPRRSPQTASPEDGAAPDYDLGIHLPNNPGLVPPSRAEVEDSNGGGYGTRRVSALTSWNMARQFSLQNRQRTARAVSTSLLSNSITASDLAMDDGPNDASTLYSNGMAQPVQATDDAEMERVPGPSGAW